MLSRDIVSVWTCARPLSSPMSSLSDELRDDLFLVWSFCGSDSHNPRNSEFFWYMFWTLALSHLFPNRQRGKVFLAPQFPVSYEQLDVHGEAKTKTHLPDFVYVYLDGNIDPSFPAALEANDESILGDASLIPRLKGPWITDKVSSMIFVEVKPLPRKVKWNHITVAVALDARQYEATSQVIRQIKAHFADHPEEQYAMAFVCVVNRWSWAKVEQTSISPVSKNEDATFRPPKKRRDRDDDLHSPTHGPSGKGKGKRKGKKRASWYEFDDDDDNLEDNYEV